MKPESRHLAAGLALVVGILLGILVEASMPEHNLVLGAFGGLFIGGFVVLCVYINAMNYRGRRP